MGKFVGIVLLCFGVWIAVAVHREGADQAFGGLFALFSAPQYGEAHRPTRSGNVADRLEEAPERGNRDEDWWAR
ncbi:MAG: hypothetical protein ABFS46_20075 [Myxococcota bacterium]